ncbi:hypothetical protein M0R89_22830 (plasmid) [Halorussus limi]|uniref:Uncharacterized protein n=1 Tax=Halorussus limi TaxID=2938695 RepID=A0A8U0I1Z8_9EURY|nr:hypothetical protein [Halorussus limi]UPV77209.1 hypothetical protein M0R89_22830 [Halorussus limi]
MSTEPTTTKSVEPSEKKSPTGDPWRYRCPNVHFSWVGLATSDEYKCKTCRLRFPEEELLDLREASADP